MTAPTTRETADHAELARRAEDKANAHIRNLRLAASRDFAVSGYSDGLIVEQDMRGMLLAAAEAFDALLSEIAALRGERDEMVEGLKDATTVHINMLRGGIAKPPPCNIGHLYRGDDAVAVVAEVMRQNPEAFPATQAERQRDELRKALKTIGEMAPSTCETSLAHDMAQFANQALANQGAE